MASQLTTTAMQTGQQFSMVPMRTDIQGNAKPFSGRPLWTTSDGTIAAVAAAPDGLSAIVTAVAPGTATITVTGDSLTGVWGINVTGEAILFVVTPATKKDGT